jgi:hypothetical protein
MWNGCPTRAFVYRRCPSRGLERSNASIHSSNLDAIVCMKMRDSKRTTFGMSVHVGGWSTASTAHHSDDYGPDQPPTRADGVIGVHLAGRRGVRPAGGFADTETYNGANDVVVFSGGKQQQGAHLLTQSRTDGVRVQAAPAAHAAAQREQ